MRLRNAFQRTLKVTAVASISTLIIALVLIQSEQRLLQHRATRLLHDYQALRLGTTTWPETQSLIHRWQHWGYASQPCSASECTYTIDIGDTLSMHLPQFSDRAWRWLGESHVMTALYLLGYRAGNVGLRFTVANGTLISDHFSVLVDVSDAKENRAYGLAMSVRSQPSLTSEQNDLSYERQMTDHPDYFVGRPGSCEGCMIGWVSFVPHLNEDEHAKLSNFQLNCFTRLVHPCKLPEDLLPAVTKYHLYGTQEEDVAPRKELRDCRVPPAALGRDALNVFVVHTLSIKAVKLAPDESEGFDTAENDTATVVEVLKGKLPPGVGPGVTIRPYAGNRYDGLGREPEHLPVASNSIIIWRGYIENGRMELEPCGILRDNPRTRTEVVSGIAQYKQFEAADREFYPSFI